MLLFTLLIHKTYSQTNEKLGKIVFSISNFDVIQISDFSKILIGLISSPNFKGVNLSISSTNSDVIFNSKHDQKQNDNLSFSLKKQFDLLEEVLANNNIRSTKVKEIVFKIYSNYGKSISLGYLIGHYLLKNPINSDQTSYNTNIDDNLTFSYFDNLVQEKDIIQTSNLSSINKIICSMNYWWNRIANKPKTLKI